MNQTSIHYADNVLNQLNAFYRFHMKQKHFLSRHLRSEVSMKLKAIFISIVSFF